MTVLSYCARLLVALTLFLILLYCPPIQLRKDQSHTPPTLVSADSPAAALLLAEHKKATDEIKMRIESHGTWFHYKTLIIGALLSGYFAYVGLAKKNPRRRPRQILLESTASAVTSTGLALALAIALIIDLHIRHDILVTNQLGLWIHNYVEPAFLGPPSERIGVGLLGWEEFLRPAPQTGMHTDPLFGLVFWPHLHGLTFVLFGSYLLVFRRVSLICASTRDTVSHCINLGSFLFVHFCIVGFAISAHILPTMFTCSPLPWLRWTCGWEALLIFGGISLALSVANAGLWYKRWSRA